MTPDDPRHGTHAGAVAHWKTGTPTCDPCLRAQRRYNKIRAREHERGQRRIVALGAEAVRVIETRPLDQLREHSGLRVDKLIRLRDGGPAQRVHRRTRDRILLADTQHYWTPVGIQRRIKGLNRLGYSVAEISRESGCDVDGLKRLRNRAKPVFVRREIAAAVIEAFDRMCMTTPPKTRSSVWAVRSAESRGYLPPLAWDDIDDPNERPDLGAHEDDSVDPVVVQRIVGGDFNVPANRAERYAVITQWISDGGSTGELIRRTGWSVHRLMREMRDSKAGAA